MKMFYSARCLRKNLLSAIAVAVMALPLLAAASTPDASRNNVQNTQGNPDLTTVEGQKRLFQKMKSKARKTCGPTNIRATGSMRRSAANKECYEDTLAIYVLRLDNSAISALHQD